MRKTAAKAEPEGTASASPAEAPLPEMTLEEVKKHASEKDCFIAVDGLVCDVTEYLPNHPGSMEQLLDVAGETQSSGLARSRARPGAQPWLAPESVQPLRARRPRGPAASVCL